MVERRARVSSAATGDQYRRATTYRQDYLSSINAGNKELVPVIPVDCFNALPMDMHARRFAKGYATVSFRAPSSSAPCT